ncbi:uncharacterized protein KNAG_0H00650 [Huiozyma naganishii CBS 8797]|uniref:Altered inheritance of mitochondria protein 3 n=1 Tax=Huiozyma naganishii (strain ATCC MYA-139 / BCRC 22969 / CBS 8797 / KCTC 17520 / NBRC 10181 / NCYC 3082 / Yp74L-3) TaxID=1071383 RepID=J7S9G7_HUIN7|nr:hypothetical protein KNAG_0H00650 [Kazachstania naganishii CBS 8797]CCK71481.1 hypothetical protein KNAG_0H00650 [Kazachstania naganishii CBS 8797]
MDSLKHGLVSAGKLGYKGTKSVAKSGYNYSKSHYNKGSDVKGKHSKSREEGEDDDEPPHRIPMNNNVDPGRFVPPPVHGNPGAPGQPAPNSHSQGYYNQQGQNSAPYGQGQQQHPQQNGYYNSQYPQQGGIQPAVGPPQNSGFNATAADNYYGRAPNQQQSPQPATPYGQVPPQNFQPATPYGQPPQQMQQTQGMYPQSMGQSQSQYGQPPGATNYGSQQSTPPANRPSYNNAYPSAPTQIPVPQQPAYPQQSSSHSVPTANQYGSAQTPPPNQYGSAQAPPPNQYGSAQATPPNQYGSAPATSPNQYGSAPVPPPNQFRAAPSTPGGQYQAPPIPANQYNPAPIPHTMNNPMGNAPQNQPGPGQPAAQQQTPQFQVNTNIDLSSLPPPPVHNQRNKIVKTMNSEPAAGVDVGRAEDGSNHTMPGHQERASPQPSLPARNNRSGSAENATPPPALPSRSRGESTMPAVSPRVPVNSEPRFEAATERHTDFNQQGNNFEPTSGTTNVIQPPVLPERNLDYLGKDCAAVSASTHSSSDVQPDTPRAQQPVPSEPVQSPAGAPVMGFGDISEQLAQVTLHKVSDSSRTGVPPPPPPTQHGQSSPRLNERSASPVSNYSNFAKKVPPKVPVKKDSLKKKAPPVPVKKPVLHKPLTPPVRESGTAGAAPDADQLEENLSPLERYKRNAMKK